MSPLVAFEVHEVFVGPSIERARIASWLGDADARLVQLDEQLSQGPVCDLPVAYSSLP